MVRLDKIYTRGGDKGETSLGDGSRCRKSAARIEACGDADEANCFIGLARQETQKTDYDVLLEQIQNDLFDLGADLCQPLTSQKTTYQPKRLTADYVKRLESHIDRENAKLAALQSFILPAGSACATWLHTARAVVRRCERHVVALHHDEPINNHVLSYLNRLSDLLFVLARCANDQGRADVLWQPEKNKIDK